MPNKRKRGQDGAGVRFQDTKSSKATAIAFNNVTKKALKPAPETTSTAQVSTALVKSAPVTSGSSISFQIVAGSYDRVLHGIHVTIPPTSISSSSSSNTEASFRDLYRFHAHTSSIRCLAVSPVSSTSARRKRLLATSSPDTKINLYHMHTRRSLGNLVPPNSSTTTVLNFPSSKTLLSGDEEGNIHVWRTRDWSLLCTMKTPVAKSTKNNVNGVDLRGGVNDIAVHETGKIALTVTRGERAVRLWNLMTGRKAGVMSFGKDDIPRSMTLGGTGEGLRVRWRTSASSKSSSSANTEGTEGAKKEEGYAVCFDRGIVIFGMDARPVYHVTPSPPSKIHQLRFFRHASIDDELLLVATEDGRVIVFSLPKPSLNENEDEDEDDDKEVPTASVIGTIGGKAAGVTGRVKDFDIITVQDPNSETEENQTFVATTGSDGIVRVWHLHFGQDGNSDESAAKKAKLSTDDINGKSEEKKEIATLVGTYETGHRITCMNVAEVEDREDSSDEDEEETKDKDGSSSESESESEDEEDEDSKS